MIFTFIVPSVGIKLLRVLQQFVEVLLGKIFKYTLEYYLYQLIVNLQVDCQNLVYLD
jgi:hypothetical protein